MICISIESNEEFQHSSEEKFQNDGEESFSSKKRFERKIWGIFILFSN